MHKNKQVNTQSQHTETVLYTYTTVYTQMKLVAQYTLNLAEICINGPGPRPRPIACPTMDRCQKACKSPQPWKHCIILKYNLVVQQGNVIYDHTCAKPCDIHILSVRPASSPVCDILTAAGCLSWSQCARPSHKRAWTANGMLTHCLNMISSSIAINRSMDPRGVL